jgi:hypothetical protein
MDMGEASAKRALGFGISASVGCAPERSPLRLLCSWCQYLIVGVLWGLGQMGLFTRPMLSREWAELVRMNDELLGVVRDGMTGVISKMLRLLSVAITSLSLFPRSLLVNWYYSFAGWCRCRINPT